jgi:transposase InsO family protein
VASRVQPSSTLNSLGGLTYVTDELSGLSLLVDTGASVSVLPHTPASSHPPVSSLSGAGGDSIATYGTVRRPLRIGGKTFPDVLFTLAAVTKAILGSDFFAANRLLVDSAGKCLRDALSLKPLGGQSSRPPKSALVASLTPVCRPVRDLLAQFPSIIGDGSDTPRPLHGVSHTVETIGRPIFAKSRRLDPEKLRSAETEFRDLERLGIVRRSDSPWSSPLHMVPKHDGTWRPCGDYRRLNAATVDDRYPLPSLQDFTAKLSGCKVFSCIDLVKGYHQVPMAAADIPKTAIITPFGLFEYVFMPFGLKNAAQTFQRLMDRLFRHLPNVFTYLDDNLIGSASVEEHWVHLREFFQILSDNGLQINPKKCTFGASSLTFLGHRVDRNGVTPLTKHVEAIRAFPMPTCLTSLQRFLGMVNFYRRFIPGLAGIVKPLTDLLRGSPKTLPWTQEAAEAVTAAKEALAQCTSLAHPLPGAVLALAVDASDTHVGGVLQQVESQNWRPLAFFSKKLSEAESKYSTFDRELLAAYSAIRHFRYLLEGRQFRLLTDHKPLIAALVRVTTPLSGRQQRHLAAITEFTTDIRYLAGDKNVVADALSRPDPTVQKSTLKNSSFPPTCTVENTTVKNMPTALASQVVTRKPCNATVGSEERVEFSPSVTTLASQVVTRGPCNATVGSEERVEFSPSGTTLASHRTTHKPCNATVVSDNPSVTTLASQDSCNALPRAVTAIDYARMATMQPTCQDVADMCNSPSLFIVEREVGGITLRGDMSTGTFRPLVPAAMRTEVMESIHAVSHPGTRATVRLVSARFCWPRLAASVTVFARECLDCQRSKVSTHVHLTPEVIDVPGRRFAHVHVDLVGPLPASRGFTYLFTVIDRTTRWPEAFPLSSMSSADCARALFDGWIQRFGVPAVITSDRGAQFTSALWGSLCSLLCITHQMTTAYHPQANGMVERLHRRLKDGLRARLSGPDWADQLPWVMLGIRSASPANGVLSPAEAVMGCQPILPGEFLEVEEAPNAVFLDRIRASALAAPRPVLHNRLDQPFELPTDLLSARMVLVRKDGVSTPLAARYDGPYLVLRRSLRVFTLQIGNKSELISTLRLKPAHASANAGVAVPPRRGRPPNATPPPVCVTPETFKTPAGEITPYQITQEAPGKKSGGNGIAQARERLTKSPGTGSSSVDLAHHPPTACRWVDEPNPPLSSPARCRTRARTREKTTPTLAKPCDLPVALPQPPDGAPGMEWRVGPAKLAGVSPLGAKNQRSFSPPTPTLIRPPDQTSLESGRPRRNRKKPVRLGIYCLCGINSHVTTGTQNVPCSISHDPSGSCLGGEL